MALTVSFLRKDNETRPEIGIFIEETRGFDCAENFIQTNYKRIN